MTAHLESDATAREVPHVGKWGRGSVGAEISGPSRSRPAERWSKWSVSAAAKAPRRLLYRCQAQRDLAWNSMRRHSICSITQTSAVSPACRLRRSSATRPPRSCPAEWNSARDLTSELTFFFAASLREQQGRWLEGGLNSPKAWFLPVFSAMP